MLAPKIDTSTDPQVGFRPPGSLDAATALSPIPAASGRGTPRICCGAPVSAARRTTSRASRHSG